MHRPHSSSVKVKIKKKIQNEGWRSSILIELCGACYAIEIQLHSIAALRVHRFAPFFFSCSISPHVSVSPFLDASQRLFFSASSSA